MHRIVSGIFAVAILTFLNFTARADTLNLVNGDRFVGTVVLVNESEVQIKSDSVGLLKVSREKVASIFFGTNRPPIDLSLLQQSAPEPLKEKMDPKAVEQVQKEFLATATPEANAMFNDLVQGLVTGKLSVDDIRKQAAESLKELRELQADAGEDMDNPLLSGYVGILEKFIAAGKTNAPASKSKSAKPAAPKEKKQLPPDDE